MSARLKRPFPGGEKRSFSSTFYPPIEKNSQPAGKSEAGSGFLNGFPRLRGRMLLIVIIVHNEVSVDAWAHEMFFGVVGKEAPYEFFRVLIMKNL